MHSKHKKIILAICLSLLIQLCLVILARSQSVGDFRSKQDGGWQDIATWEIYDPGGWIPAGTYPDQHSGIIKLSHQVFVVSDQVLDQVTIEANASLSIHPGVMVTATNSSAQYEIIIKGTVLNQGMLFFSPSSKMLLDSGGTYIHNSSVSSSALLDASGIDPSSTFIYRGNGSLSPPVSFSNRTYGHLIFESSAGSWSRTITGSNPLHCTSLTVGSNVMLINNLNSTITIQGNLTVNGSLVNGIGTQKIILEGWQNEISGNNLNNLCDTLIFSIGSNYTLLNNLSGSASSTLKILGTLNLKNNSLNGNNNGSNIYAGKEAILITEHAAGIKGSIKQFSTTNFDHCVQYQFTGSVPQVSGLYSDTLSNLSIDKISNHLTLDNNIYATGTITLIKGNVIANLNTLFVEVSNSSALVGGSDSSFVSGNLCLKIPPSDSIEVIFPIGENYYNPISFLSLKNTDTTFLNATVKESVPNGSADTISLSGSMMNRVWKIKTQGANHISSSGRIKLSPAFSSFAINDSAGIGISLNDSTFSYHGIGGILDSAGIYSASMLNNCQLKGINSVNELLISIADRKIDDAVFEDSSCNALLKLKFYLQGPYSGNGLMNNNALSPVYCDSVNIEIREDIDPFIVLHSFQSVLKTDGTMEARLPVGLNHVYYLVIKHRKSIETWSGSPIQFNDTLIQYDFSTDASQAFGNNQVELSAGVYAIYTGDIADSSSGSSSNQDGIINQADLLQLENDLRAFLSGDQPSDLNGDQIVDNSDYSLLENNLILGIRRIKP